MTKVVCMKLSASAAALFLFALPTLAGAHGGNNDPNVVHACIGNISKVVRVVGVGGTCLSSPPIAAETPAHWNIEGPAGAPGINGTNGTNGINGTNGTNGRDGIDGAKGADGLNGTNGTNGTNGVDGTSATFVDYFSGASFQGAATGCVNGGVVYAAGNPPVNAYVCNGINGTNGTNGTNGAGVALHSLSDLAGLSCVNSNGQTSVLTIRVGAFQTLLNGGQVSFVCGLRTETQIVRVTNATGGTFTLTFNGQTTGPIPFNATPAQTQAALEAVFGVGNLTVLGSSVNGTTHTVVFGGSYAGQNVAQITGDASGLTGTQPTLTVRTENEGGQ